jgi:hypothetical protein
MAIRGHNDCRLKDLEMMGTFSHTGCNEALNSLHNKVLFFFKLAWYCMGVSGIARGRLCLTLLMFCKQCPGHL